MQQKKAHNTNEYLKTKIMTASPEELQLMLYDGAIRFCEQGRAAIEEKKIEESYRLLVKAQDIILEMCNSLRDEICPETCSNMRSLYIFVYEKLVKANIEKNVSCVDEALKVIRHMRETWVLLIEKLNEERGQEQAGEAPSPEPHAAPVPVSTGDFDQGVGTTISIEG